MIRHWKKISGSYHPSLICLQRSKFSTAIKLNQFTANESGNIGKDFKVGSGGKSDRLMRAWELHTYGGPNELQLTASAKMPVIKNPKDVLVRVLGSSLNPIDLRMTTGYGSTVINYLRWIDSSGFLELSPSRCLNQSNVIEFPLTLGRDFSGIVTEIGNSVNDFRVGDEVFGVLGVQRNGSQADYVITSSDMIKLKPKALSFIEAGTVSYVGLTTLSAVHITGGYRNLVGKKFLILGGSGGLGTFAIQYLRASGAYVVSTCSSDALKLLGELGCNFAVDYKDSEYISHIQSQAPFDCILDLTGSSSQPLLEKFLSHRTGQYITLSSPFLTNVDKYGVVGGMIANINNLSIANLKSVRNDRVLSKWAFFIPCTQGMDVINSMLQTGKIRPIIHETYRFEDLPMAYEKLRLGHTRGKIAIDNS